MDDILILGEVREGSLDLKTLELVTVAKRLAEKLKGEYCLLLMGDSVSKASEEALSYGLSRVYNVEHPLLKAFKSEFWLNALEQVLKEIMPRVFLLSHSYIGMELGPRLAYRMNTVLTTDCIELDIDPEDGLLLRTKPISGGNAIGVFRCPGNPQMVTLRGKVFEPATPAEARGEVSEIRVELDESINRIEYVETVKEESVLLDKADVIVAGGAGLGEKDGFKLLEQLAEVLKRKSFGNVMIGCSRVAVDKGWISSDHQVGLTGTFVAPDIYVAVGISGAIQHLVGMVHSKKIIAINTDPGCNMFKVADYGVVEDYQKVIPALIKNLEEV